MLRPFAVLLVSLAPLAAPADTLSYTWTPRTAEEADALRAGLMLYSLHNELQNGGTVEGWGREHLAALTQPGSANWGAIVQDGNGHSASLTQTGGGNAHAIIQAGEGATAGVTQTGGEAGITVQIGY
jgi:Curlin associated repeat